MIRLSIMTLSKISLYISALDIMRLRVVTLSIMRQSKIRQRYNPVIS